MNAMLPQLVGKAAGNGFASDDVQGTSKHDSWRCSDTCRCEGVGASDASRDGEWFLVRLKDQFAAFDPGILPPVRAGFEFVIAPFAGANVVSPLGEAGCGAVRLCGASDQTSEPPTADATASWEDKLALQPQRSCGNTMRCSRNVQERPSM